MLRLVGHRVTAALPDVGAGRVPPVSIGEGTLRAPDAALRAAARAAPSTDGASRPLSGCRGGARPRPR
jgi:hypothetical protein